MQEGKVQNVAVVRTTNVMTPVTQVLVPGHVAAPGSVQMAKIAPATTALPTQLTTVLPASNITSGIPVVQPAVTSTKTILPQTTLQQVQGHNVVINRANMQQLQMSGEVGKLHTYILYLVQPYNHTVVFEDQALWWYSQGLIPQLHAQRLMFS